MEGDFGQVEQVYDQERVRRFAELTGPSHHGAAEFVCLFELANFFSFAFFASPPPPLLIRILLMERKSPHWPLSNLR